MWSPELAPVGWPFFTDSGPTLDRILASVLPAQRAYPARPRPAIDAYVQVIDG